MMSDTASTDQSKSPVLTSQKKEWLRALPSVSNLLEHEEVRDWLHGLPRSAVLASIQAAIDTARKAILADRLDGPVEVHDLLACVERELLQRSIPSLRHVINATGIVLHTALGRAPLSDAALEAVMESASSYCNLEYDLTTGHRRQRNHHVASYLASITGGEAATVVNNNAAAILLILRTLALGHEVIVSRGQLVEIGGSFRLPDIMRESGACLCEVGTTNRTRIADYQRAISENTAMLLRVHPSNYRVVGFTEEASLQAIADLAHRHNLIAVDDLGSGALFDLTVCGLPEEPCVRDSLEAGADLVCFSGDKLLGGPQCGIIVGRRDLIEKIEEHPLMRTYRVGKLTLLTLEATLRAYPDPAYAATHVPALAMLAATTDQLAQRANQLVEQLAAALPDEHFYIGSDVDYAGGGSLPTRELDTVVVQWQLSHTSAQAMASALREAETPVIVRIRDEAICFDLRTIQNDDVDTLVASVAAVVWDESAASDPERVTPDA